MKFLEVLITLSMLMVFDTSLCSKLPQEVATRNDGNGIFETLEGHANKPQLVKGPNPFLTPRWPGTYRHPPNWRDGPNWQFPGWQVPNGQGPDIRVPNWRGPNWQGPNMRASNGQDTNWRAPNWQGPYWRGPYWGDQQTMCQRNPRICRTTGDRAGPDCCGWRCVNLMTDSFNCGKCGIRCKYSEICCDGRCVNPFWDKQHCGRCKNSCNQGGSCGFGMCSYA